jgi:hypothetical protein
MAFYIVETTEQLDEIFEKNYKNVFVEPIYFNDNIHPILNDVSLLYLKSLDGDKGYILCLSHNESLSLHKSHINDLLLTYDEVYVRDRKAFIFHFPAPNIIDISFNINKEIDITTQTHKFFYFKHEDKENVNTIIPLVKHYEKCELIFEEVKQHCVLPDNWKFYNKLSTIFFIIEKNGLKINKHVFDEFFKPHNELYSISNNKIHTKYNLHTTTRRPSDSFNGVNFSALNKTDGRRKAFIPENDYFIEIDITAYHPTIMGKLMGFDFKDETPYEYFAREANIDIKEAKVEFIKQMYGGIQDKYKDILFFSKLSEYLENIWEEFQTAGKCTSLSGVVFKPDVLKNMNPNKLLSYLIQGAETYFNVEILWEVIKLTRKKQTKVVLYVYDSILIDYNEDENLLEQIKEIFIKHNLKIKLTKGFNYGSMITI